MTKYHIDPLEWRIDDHLNDLAKTVHGANVRAGWWTDLNLAPGAADYNVGSNLKERQELLRYVIPTKLALAHSELSEALEGFRKGLMDDHLPHRKMIEVELADALIRIFDIAGALDLDLGSALVEKFNYNQTREDHKPEARAGEGGKKI